MCRLSVKQRSELETLLWCYRYVTVNHLTGAVCSVFIAVQFSLEFQFWGNMKSKLLAKNDKRISEKRQEMCLVFFHENWKKMYFFLSFYHKTFSKWLNFRLQGRLPTQREPSSFLSRYISQKGLNKAKLISRATDLQLWISGLCGRSEVSAVKMVGSGARLELPRV